MSVLQVNTSFNIDLQFETAPFHLRLIGWLIDFIIMIIYVYFFNWLLNISIGKYATDFGLTELFISIPLLLYHLLCEIFMNGQSIGKKLIGIQVVSANGKNATISQYLLRWLMRSVDFGLLMGLVFIIMQSFFIGALMVLTSIVSFIILVSSANNQRLGDMIAGTVVVLKKLPYALSDTIFQELDVKGYKVTFPAVMRLSDKDVNIIDNVIKQHYKNKINAHLDAIANKIKMALNLETDMDSEMFLECLLRDYNFLSRK